MKIHFLRILGLLITFVFCLPTYADNIVVFGASGNFGSKIVHEALDRGHQVYGVSRSPDKFTYTEDNFNPVEGNPTVLESVMQIVADVKPDAILVALGDRQAQTPEETAMNQTAIVLSTALADQGKDGPPVVVLGGGNTSADSEEGMMEILKSRGGEDNPRLKQIFLSQWVTYQTYKNSDINWIYVATPGAILGVGNYAGDPARTGKYRASTDGSLDREANTGLSRADIAVAMMDFAESGEYSQMRVKLAQEKSNQE